MDLLAFRTTMERATKTMTVECPNLGGDLTLIENQRDRRNAIVDSWLDLLPGGTPSATEKPGGSEDKAKTFDILMGKVPQPDALPFDETLRLPKLFHPGARKPRRGPIGSIRVYEIDQPAVKMQIEFLGILIKRDPAPHLSGS
jgi:hypothetical protein